MWALNPYGEVMEVGAPAMVVKFSLLLNVVVLLPVCLGLLLNADGVAGAYRTFTAARGILLSIYVAIGLGSVFLLLNQDLKFVAALLWIQVVYKLTTPLTVGTVSNLAIAAVHAVTLFLIFRQGGR